MSATNEDSTDQPMMRAVGFTRSLAVTDPDSLVDVTVPVPSVGEHDLLVDVRAVSVNPVDTKVRLRSGDQSEPKILGYDGAGVVRALGSAVTLFDVGDEVYYAGTINRPGTNAELHVVDERIVGHKPRSLDFAEAAALPLTAITAWESLFDRLGLTAESGGTLLVVGASGGVGSVMLQLAEALLPGVSVVATASHDDAAAWVRELGAEHVVNHREDLASQLESIAPEGVDYLFTAHSSGQFAVYAQVMKPFGNIVAIDDPSEPEILALKAKSIGWHWESMFTRSVFQTADMQQQHELLEHVAELVDTGGVRSTMSDVRTPLDAATLRQAHADIESGHTVGKIVVRAG